MEELAVEKPRSVETVEPVRDGETVVDGDADEDAFLVVVVDASAYTVIVTSGGHVSAE